jgi:hypothetical protein
MTMKIEDKKRTTRWKDDEMMKHYVILTIRVAVQVWITLRVTLQQP